MAIYIHMFSFEVGFVVYMYDSVRTVYAAYVVEWLGTLSVSGEVYVGSLGHSC